MKAIQIAFALCFGSLLLAGCGPSKALQSAQMYEKDACACKDVACVTDATKKFGEKQKDVATSAKSDEAEAMTKHATAAAACMTKAAMAERPRHARHARHAEALSSPGARHRVPRRSRPGARRGSRLPGRSSTSATRPALRSSSPAAPAPAAPAVSRCWPARTCSIPPSPTRSICWAGSRRPAVSRVWPVRRWSAPAQGSSGFAGSAGDSLERGMGVSPSSKRSALRIGRRARQC